MESAHTENDPGWPDPGQILIFMRPHGVDLGELFWHGAHQIDQAHEIFDTADDTVSWTFTKIIFSNFLILIIIHVHQFFT